MENPKRKRDAVEEASLPDVELTQQQASTEEGEGVVEDEAVEGEWSGGGLLFECMPAELCQEVFDLLKTKDLIRLTRVSRWMRGRVLTLLRSYRVRSTEADDVRSSFVYYRRLEGQAAHPSDEGDEQDNAEDEEHPHHKKRRKKKRKEEKRIELLKSRDDYSVTLAQFLDLIATECPRLRCLDLSLIKRPAQHLAQAILHLPSTLTSLNLSYSGLEGSGNLEHLHRVVPSLTLLDVSHCTQLSIAAFKKLPDELTTLKARGIRKFNSSMFASLPSTLTSLDLRDCSHIEWPSETSKLPPALRTLRITVKDRPSHNAFGWFQTQSPAERTCPFSQMMQSLPEGLQRLDLSQSTCFLSIEVASLPRAMHSLSFHKCSGVRSEVLRHLPTHLRSLDLSDCREIVGLKLNHLTALETLNLDRWRQEQNPKGELLKRLPDSLRVLTLRQATAISDKDLMYVPLGLQVLDVWGCSVSLEALSEMIGNVRAIRQPNGTWHYRTELASGEARSHRSSSRSL